ncbi:DeoR/GlpR family DNA-binding transcription regulator [Pasteurellaceae bacterium TAE3-ERU1]|nr:DeoR/GlpR family DNA-binding transcription regulator [Pasteurellaceae bacterium TAE3-ERU1]
MRDRHSTILHIVNSLNKVTVSFLSEQLHVSVETIRRDLNVLSNRGLLHRTHGGALSKKTDDIGYSFQKRQKLNVNEKRQLAERVLDYIFEGAVIGLDASSTSWYVAQYLPNIPCSVVTNSMHNINALVNKPLIKTIATGGLYSSKYDAFYGPLSEHLLSRLHIHIGIFSCVGIDNEGAIWESNELNASIKRKMMDVSSQRFLLVDGSKFEHQNLVKLADLSKFDILFSNENPPYKLVNYCRKNNILIFNY